METNVDHRLDERAGTGTGSNGTGQEGRAAKQQLGCEEQEQLADRIGRLADRIRAHKLPLDKVAAEVCKIDRILETVALPMPPSPANLGGALGNLARGLKATGNLALAESIATRLLMIDCDQTGARRWQEPYITALAEIWAGMGRLDDAKVAYRDAATRAQERLRPEVYVFDLLYQCGEIAMMQEDFSLAAIVFDRAAQMESVDRDTYAVLRGLKYTIYQEILFKLKFLPLKKRVKTPVEVEYDRVAEERRRAAKKAS